MSVISVIVLTILIFRIYYAFDMIDSFENIPDILVLKDNGFLKIILPRHVTKEKFTLIYDLIGRTDNCDIEIIDQSVSKRHAIIEVTPDGSAFIKDLASANNTFKNGTELRKNVVYDLSNRSDLKFGLVNAKLSIVSNSPSLRSTDHQSQHSHDELFADVSMTESITNDVSIDSNKNSNDPAVTENLDNIARKMGIKQSNYKRTSAEIQHLHLSK